MFFYKKVLVFSLFFLLSIYDSYCQQNLITHIFKDMSFSSAFPQLKNLSINNMGELYIVSDAEEWAFLKNSIGIWDIFESENKIYIAASNPARVFELTEKNKLQLIQEFKNSLMTVQLLVYEKNIYIANALSSELVIFSLSENKVTHRFSFKDKYLWRMLLDKTRNKIFLAAGGQSARLYEIDLKDLRSRLLLELKNENNFISLAQEKDNLYFGSSEKGTLYKYNLVSKTLDSLFQEKGEVKDILIHPKTKDIYFILSNKIHEMHKKLNTNKEANINKIKILNSKYFHFNKLYVLDGESKIRKKIFEKSDSQFLKMKLNPLSNKIYIGTGNDGLIYEINIDIAFSSSHYFMRIPEHQVSSFFINSKEQLYISSMNKAKLFKIDLNDKKNKEASYTSEIIYLKNPVLWGKIFIPYLKNLDALDVFIRTGNTADIDSTWSEWKKINVNSDEINRFDHAIQYKIILKKNYPYMQGLDSIQLSYFDKKLPKINSFSLVKGNSKSNHSSLIKSLKWAVLTDENKNINNKENSSFDDFSFSIFFRKRNQNSWTLLDNSIKSNFYEFDQSKFPDGEYQFKISLNSLEENSFPSLSPFFTLDSSSPVLKVEKILKKENEFIIEGFIEDFSLIKELYYSLNYSDWIPIKAQDSMYDSKKENFSFSISKDFLNAKDNFIVLKVSDIFKNFSLQSINLN